MIQEVPQRLDVLGVGQIEVHQRGCLGLDLGLFVVNGPRVKPGLAKNTC